MDLAEQPESDNDDAGTPPKSPASGGAKGNVTKQFRCAVCARGFARRDKLERHNRVHSGEKPFLCFECGRAFARRDKLIRHRKEVHTGERPFRCELCSRSFARRDTLKTHHRIHEDRESTKVTTESHQSPWVSLLESQAIGLKKD